MKKDEIIGVVKRVLSGPDGEKFEQLLRDVCGFNQSSFSDNPYRMAYNQGRHDVYLYIKKLKEEKYG